MICFPIGFAKKAAEVVLLIVKDEFQQEFDIPENVVVPPGSRIECKVFGKPRVAFAQQAVNPDGFKPQVKLVIVVQAVVKLIIRNPEGRAIAVFFAVFERRIETDIKLPLGVELVVKDVLIDCGPCKRRLDKIVCDIRVRVIFKVVAAAAFDP